MKKAILVAVIGAMTLGVKAGEWGKAVIPSKHVIEDCVDVGGEISAGYMTDYIFYGVRFARDSVWTDVNYTFDNLVVPINIGAWYLNGIDPAGYDELNLYASADLGTFAGFDVELGYTHYFFPEANAGGSYGEIGLGVVRSLGFVDFVAETNYALSPVSGWYHQLGLEKTFGITDSISLVAAAGWGFSDGYFALGNARTSGYNHYYVTLSLPIELNCRATLTPYIGYNGKGGGIAGQVLDQVDFDGVTTQPDILHGGVSLSVSF